MVNCHFASSRDVFCGCPMAELGEGIAVVWESGFGPVSKTHQGLFASLSTASYKNAFDFRRRHRPGVRVIRIFSEGAVPASVPTKIGNREENLSGICDGPVFELIAQGR